ncbi:hypothetical protein [Myroides odoratus]|uniref:hypothetical protein n=1 Tax=Myroides odoratus TaxID=256 RepID=UPI0039B0D64D
MRLLNQFMKGVKVALSVGGAVSVKEDKTQPEFNSIQSKQNNEQTVNAIDKQVTQKKEKRSTNLDKNKTMAMFNYGVGGNEIKVDANEAIQEIQGNKSLLVAKLTTEEVMAPEIVTGLKTVDDVFKYYAPTVEVEHETLEGQTIKEAFRFANVGDFTPKKIVENSSFLKGLKVDEEQFNKVVKQLRINKVLRKLLEDEQAKQAFIDTIQRIAKELEEEK